MKSYLELFFTMTIFSVSAYIGYLLIYSAIALGLFFGFRAIKLI